MVSQVKHYNGVTWSWRIRSHHHRRAIATIGDDTNTNIHTIMSNLIAPSKKWASRMNWFVRSSSECCFLNVYRTCILQVLFIERSQEITVGAKATIWQMCEKIESVCTRRGVTHCWIPEIQSCLTLKRWKLAADQKGSFHIPQDRCFLSFPFLLLFLFDSVSNCSLPHNKNIIII